MKSNEATWPALDYAEWQDSCATLHLLTQIVGKIRLAHAPLVNHWWQVPLYVTSRGLTTSAMPHGARNFQIDFDFIDHQLRIEASDGRRDSIPLIPRPVADFYAELMGRLRALDLETHLWTMPVEIADPIAFEEDRVHAAYDPEQVTRFWRALVQIDQVFTVFRSRFLGKASPVHFFWGSFDLAVTRFSGRPAPAPPGSPQHPRFHHPRGLFARGQQLRVLAGQRRLRPPGVLFLRLPRARRVCRRGDPAAGRLLQQGFRRVYPAL